MSTYMHTGHAYHLITTAQGWFTQPQGIMMPGSYEITRGTH